jgi:hypothetical protein
LRTGFVRAGHPAGSFFVEKTTGFIALLRRTGSVRESYGFARVSVRVRTGCVRVEFVEKPVVLQSFLKIEVTAAYGDRTGIVRVEYDLVNKSRFFFNFMLLNKTDPCFFFERKWKTSYFLAASHSSLSPSIYSHLSLPCSLLKCQSTLGFPR